MCDFPTVNKKLCQVLPVHGQVPEGDGGGGQRQGLPHGRPEGRAHRRDGVRVVKKAIAFLIHLPKLLVAKRDSVLYKYYLLSGPYHDDFTYKYIYIN